MMKKPFKTDVAVFINFFNRPIVLQKVFEAVKEGRPSKLFLSCDGARVGREDDIVNIKECQKIVENIDWECEVHKNYSEKNLGCGMRMYTGITWALQHVESVIILEDDCVPSQSFLPFCKELLDKYKDDQRIYMISGMNHLGIYEKPTSDYFFGPGCCCGWATWRRAWEAIDFSMSFLENKYEMQCVTHLYPYYRNAIAIGEERLKKLSRGEKLTAWTYQSGMAAALNNQISILPTKNLITNIGLTNDSTHGTNNLRKLPKRTQAYFFIPTYEYEFPLKHPQYVIEDRMYYEIKEKKFKTNIFTRLEGIIRRVIFADKGEVKGMISRKLKRKRK